MSYGKVKPGNVTVGRRAVLAGGVWAATAVIVAVGTPAIAASVAPEERRGVLHTNGYAHQGEMALSGVTWDDTSADKGHLPGEVIISLNLPGEITEISADPYFWSVTKHEHGAVISNALPMVIGEVQQAADVIIRGDFNRGENYTSYVEPLELEVSGVAAPGEHKFI